MTTTTTTVQDVREQAAQRFAQLGWPTPQQEEWKYTNVAPIARVPWKFGAPGPIVDHDARFHARAAAELVFVNGHLVEQSAPLWKTANGEHYARYADYMRHPFTALNTANAQDGARIEIPEGTVVEGFIHLLFIGDGDGIWSHPRNLIVVGRNAQVAVVETYVGRGAYFTNAVTELVAQEGAVVDHTKVECESLQAFHVGTLQIHQGRSSSVTSRCFAIGGALARNEINVALAGEGASITLDGLFTLTGNQHADNHTVIDHLYPHCDSVELYKGILDQSARGIFDGRIIVRPDAQKTSSRQTNHNLLLSETAIVDSKPTLEIHNDDVKCNHGSTIGQLDEEAMFYLRSRGIGETEARELLIYAFASEIVDRIKIEAVREQVRRQMFRRMPDRLPERRER
jgi:Fe-S cluster assembly protein SufD